MNPDEETISITLPWRHAEILRSLSEETEVPIGQVVAEAIAMLHCVHIGVWLVVQAPLVTDHAESSKRNP